MTKTTKVEQVIKLWLWQINNDIFVAYDSPFPCDDDGNPLTIGEPNAVAEYRQCSERSGHEN